MNLNHFAKALASQGITLLTILQLISLVTVSSVSGEDRTNHVREDLTPSTDPQSPIQTLFDNNFNKTLVHLSENYFEELGQRPQNGFVWGSHYSTHTGHDNAIHYTNEWLVHLHGGDQVVNRIAAELGLENVGQVEGFPGVYLLRKRDHPSGLNQKDRKKSSQLMSYPEVILVDQQFAKTRAKREVDISKLLKNLDFVNRFSTADDLLKKTFNINPSPKISFIDPLWKKEWYLQDTKPRRDLNVIPVFQMGYTGKGVNVVILDDGLEYTHTDLKKNYVPSISYDFNSNDTDPMPSYDPPRPHGTECAGVVAMQANNSKCGVGIAYNAGIGGVRMLDGDVSDYTEGASLIYALKKVDIYSASWGPGDDGKTLERPGLLAQAALIKGVVQGRNGRGVIYVWASGNGGKEGDNCGCDGYASNIFTMSIGSATESGCFPYYGEKCASTIAVAYSGGEFPDQEITSPKLRNQCSRKFTGTSAATPLAAGIVALTLEANPQLTWRDIQHLTVWTSRPGPLEDNPGWKVNAAGHRFNSRFGFGLMNAYSMVQAAKNWTTVPDLKTCRVKALPIDKPKINSTWITVVKFKSDACSGTFDEVKYLEHVQLTVSIRYSTRGALNIMLMSPQSTETNVLFPRKKDDSTEGFKKWTFSSVHTWGENPKGTWKVFITDPTGNLKNKGRIEFAELVLHGSTTAPKHTLNGPRVYPEYDNDEAY